MMIILIIFFLPLSQSIHESSPLFGRTRSFYDEFLDILQSADNCNAWFLGILAPHYPRNNSMYKYTFQKELFELFLELRKDGLDDVVIEKLMEIYCEAKNEEMRLLNSWRATLNLRGNYSWTDHDWKYKVVPGHSNYLTAKFKFLRKFHIATSGKKKEQQISADYHDNVKYFFRIAAFLITSSLAVTIRNLLHMYYRVDGEVDDELRDANIRVELMQATVMLCSLTCIITQLYYKEEKQ